MSLLSKIFNASLIYAASAIGAGMLMLPTIAGLFGIVPALIIATCCALYMGLTACMLAEMYFWFDTEINLVSLAQYTLGKAGVYVVLAAYLFLFFCLIIAYLAKGGDLLNTFIPASLGLPAATGATLLALCSLIFSIYDIKFLSKFNIVCTFGLLLAFVLMILLSIKYFSLENIAHVSWSGSYFLIPFMVTSFGFHNMIGTVKNKYLPKSLEQNILSCILGTIIPLLIYIVWISAVLGVVPLTGKYGILASYKQGLIIVEPLGAIVRSRLIGTLAQAFALLAIITSLVPQTLSLKDFILDATNLPRIYQNKILISFTVLLTALYASQAHPYIFERSLELAGTYAALTLFGVLPPLMLYKGRYKLNLAQGHAQIRVGKKSIYLTSGAAIFLIIAKFFGIMSFNLH